MPQYHLLRWVMIPSVIIQTVGILCTKGRASSEPCSICMSVNHSGKIELRNYGLSANGTHCYREEWFSGGRSAKAQRVGVGMGGAGREHNSLVGFGRSISCGHY